MRPLLRLLQVELGPTDHDLMTMIHERLYQIFQIKQLRTAIHQRDVIHAKRGLQGCQLIQFVQHHTRVRVALHVDDNPHTLPVGLIVHVRDPVNPFLVDQVRDVLDQLRLIDQIRNLGNDNLLMIILHLDLRLSTQHDASAPRLEGLLHTRVSIYSSACREIRGLDIAHQPLHIDISTRVDISDTTIQHLT